MIDAMPDQVSSAQKPAVFFDGACPLCRREIGVYQRIDNGTAIEWVDVSACELAALPNGLSQADAQARFHVRRADGTVISGAAAFAEMWTYTPGFRALGSIAKIAPVTAILELIYRGFLIIRPGMQSIARSMERL
jgi:3-demethoxyubiquinol 3-hydroxylase